MKMARQSARSCQALLRLFASNLFDGLLICLLLIFLLMFFLRLFLALFLVLFSTLVTHGKPPVNVVYHC